MLEPEKHYELVLQEYRFQVQLNWDRAKHFLVFNTAALAAAVALYKTGSTAAGKAGVAALLLLSTLNAFAGQHAVGVGHRYYQSVRDLKTVVEKNLGLNELAIQSTSGMKVGHDTAPAGTPAHRQGRWGKITTQIRALLVVIGVLSAVGTLYASCETVCTLKAADGARIDQPTPSASTGARPPP